MKKVFSWVIQGVLKYRKKLVYGALVLFISQICFFNLGGIGVKNGVFAAEGEVSQSVDIEKEAKDWNDTISFCLRLTYALLYPLLAIAGKLVDNSFVYGEVFGFDAVLWNLRNITKNAANYTLGFLFVYKIFEFLIKQKSEDMKKLLVSGLIAGVGIQASWFIMAALIDISTILTYSVGGFPIYLSGKADNSGNTDYNDYKTNPYMLKTVVSWNVKDPDSFAVYLTNTTGGKYGDFYISECKTFYYSSGLELILAPKMIYYLDEKNEVHLTEGLKCHAYGQVYQFGGLYSEIGEFPFCEGTGCVTVQSQYDASLQAAEKIIKGTGQDIVGLVNNAVLLQLGDAHISGGVLGNLGSGVMLYTNEAWGLDNYNKNTGKGKTVRLRDVLDEESYVGVYTVLYSSLINSVGIVPKGISTFGDLLSQGLRLGHMMAIAIPLVVVAIVFMMRIGILWAAITLSPFIVLLTAFDLWKSDILSKEGLKFLQYFNPEGLIPIIFSPAIICFAISLSTVLVTIIDQFNASSVAIGSDGEIWGGLVRLNISGVTIPLAKMVIALFGIAVTWFLVWAAVEMSKIGESNLVQSIKGLARQTLGSIPVVPLPTKDGKMTAVGVDTIFGTKDSPGIVSNITTQIQDAYRGGKTAAMNALVHGAAEEQEAAEHRVSAYKRNLVKIKNIGSNWTEQEIMIGEKGNEKGVKFGEFGESDKESIIEAINSIDDQNKREAFGKSQPEVHIGNDVYEFVETRPDASGKTENVYKYEKKGASS